MGLSRTPPPVCARCSKPITRGGGVPLPGTGEFVHARCASLKTALENIEAQDRARRLKERTDETRNRANRIVRETRAMTTCPLCGLRLSAGGSVIFQGDRLVHARCWTGSASSREPKADG